jgi:hypothetical protein
MRIRCLLAPGHGMMVLKTKALVSVAGALKEETADR